AGEPRVDYQAAEAPAVKSGTSVRVRCPSAASYQAQGWVTGFYRLEALAAAFAFFNPDVALIVNEDRPLVEPIAPPRRWRPCDPISPHWYDLAALCGLVAAHIQHEREGGEAVTVRHFVQTFDGLTGTRTAKEVVEAAGLAKAWLRDLAGG